VSDVMVVGGGVMGLCIALCLRRRGASVTLAEKRFVGAGASGKSGAILRQHYSNALTVAMARDGLRAYADFEAWAGGPSGFLRVGCLILADRAERAALEGNVGLMQDAGCAASLVTAEEVRALAPMISVPDEALGAWEPDAGYCDPVTTLATLEAACRREGVDVQTGAEVVRIARQGNAAVAVGFADGTTQEAGAAVVAAGPWTNRLLGPLGYEAPITTTRPLLAFFARPLDLPDHPVIGDLLSGVYCRPDDGRTLVGALDLSQDDVVDDPDAYDEAAPDTFLAFCRERVTRRLPALGRGFGRGGYAGLYDCTPDMHPVLGAVPGAENIFVAAGFSGHGFKLAPVVGQGVAELVTAGRFASLDLSALAPTRYAEGRPVRAAYEYGLLG
jgi:Glycine/D-amino acid oxidases (deaminating)